MNNEEEEHIELTDPSTELFDMLLNDRTKNDSLKLNQKIARKTNSITKIITKTIGKGPVTTKSSSLETFEKGLKNKLLKKDGVFMNMIPKLKIELLHKEVKLKNSLKDKINLGEMTYLVLAPTGLSNEKQRENEIKRKILLRSSNFIYRKKNIYSNQIGKHQTNKTDDLSKYSNNNSKTIYLTNTNNRANSSIKKYEYYSQNKSKVLLPTSTINANNTASTFFFNNNSSIMFNDDSNNNSSKYNITSQSKRYKSKHSKIKNIKLNLFNIRSNEKEILNDSKDESSRMIHSTRGYFVNNKTVKQLDSKNNKKIVLSKKTKKVNGKQLSLTINELGTHFNVLRKNLNTIIENSKINKKTNKFIHEDINTILQSKRKEHNEIQQSLSKLSEPKSISTQGVVLGDQVKFIENSLKFVTERLSDKQAMNYIDKLMFGYCLKVKKVKEDEKEEDIIKESQLIENESKQVSILRDRLDNQLMHLSKMKTQLVQKNIKLIKRLEEDINKNKRNRSK